ncbi:MAG TPA: patatin-like phospholipase family protein [Caulobacteraceae bacterium]|nr:patatin-like phospholipase family protein [Caulobacteraceae bacterium]
MAALTDSLPPSALTRLFAREVAAGRAVWFSLPGGAALYEAGEDADNFYLLRAGRLGAFRREEGREAQFLGVIRPGEPAGEMALIAGSPHSATVAALRDSEVLALDRDAFFRAVEADPGVMTELARLMILRNRQSASGGVMGEPSVFAFIAANPNLEARPLVADIASRIGRLGYRVTVVGAEALQAPTEWFSNVERDHDFVLYVAEANETAWKTLVGRQGDRLFRVADGGGQPTAARDGPAAAGSETLQSQQLVDLILIHPADCRAPTNGEVWIDTLNPARLFHARAGNAADADRLARVLAGQSVGLVLSGGGARAYAHIGAVRAMQERGVPIDFLGGVSMGAIIGAGYAMGWDDPEMERRIRKAFVETSPLDDMALPLIAMTHGEKVRERLAEHFGDRNIADLWLPFFCVSTNLTRGAYQLHRTGLVREALRASLSLPGVLPPVAMDNDVLVDGAVVKNFPADIMRSIQLGPIVGVDVGRGRSIEATDIVRPPSIWRWVLSGEWRRGPPIVSVLMRAATVRAGADSLLAHQAADVLIQPDVDDIEIRDWKAFEPGVAAGYAAAVEVLDRLSHPVIDLRRRASLDDNLRPGSAPSGRRGSLANSDRDADMG